MPRIAGPAEGTLGRFPNVLRYAMSCMRTASGTIGVKLSGSTGIPGRMRGTAVSLARPAKINTSETRGARTKRFSSGDFWRIACATTGTMRLRRANGAASKELHTQCTLRFSTPCGLFTSSRNGEKRKKLGGRALGSAFLCPSRSSSTRSIRASGDTSNMITTSTRTPSTPACAAIKQRPDGLFSSLDDTPQLCHLGTF